MKSITIQQSLNVSGGTQKEGFEMFVGLIEYFFGDSNSTNSTYVNYSYSTYTPQGNLSGGNYTYSNGTYNYTDY